ncbi:MAG TPA: MerR family transcriptional regulator [Candidatus Limnocylindria bacterium]|nr:MerR family transcriptional regulator [Candidatus Limnocylindria bacterium]
MYTIKEASARSGVSVPLLRAWERRYGVVAPTRTASGYRLYDDGDLARLMAMRRLIEDGWAPQQAAARVRSADPAGLEALAAGPQDASVGVAAPTGAPSADAAHRELVDRMVLAAQQLDAAALGAALDEAFAVLRFESAWEAVLLPALHRIGDGWHRGEIDVAGEHASSQTIHRRMAMAFEAAGAATANPPILVGLGPATRHEFGALAFAVAARRAGLPVLYLGADVPVDSWVTAATERRAAAVVIGVPRRADVDHAKEVVNALRRECPETPVLVGGAFSDRIDTEGVLRLPEDSLAAAVTALASVVGARARQPG